MGSLHSFHIPVMGIGYTLDTPIKVSQWGINSVISIVDDILIEKVRKFYCEKYYKPYIEISAKELDARSRRITEYLNLIYEIIADKRRLAGESFQSQNQYIETYLSLLPVEKANQLRIEIINLRRDKNNWDDILAILNIGDIDVNIMTKSDKENYFDGELLPREFNDAHAALRGFAKSKLQSSIVFSAGLNQKLFQYLENFEDFYPDINGNFKKKITLKVSDFRSALVQGKILAKYGMWVSEYRLESGLNCGGHAFATNGILMGPALEEFLIKREELEDTLLSILKKALNDKNKIVPEVKLKIKFSAQGGVGTNEEHEFLLSKYKLNSIGWGTPFLLVPEATSVDHDTLEKLKIAKEEDLYLSNTSPYGIPFHTLRNNSKDLEKNMLIQKGRPGSSCPKKFVSLNNEFTKEKICVASREYQYLKLKQLSEASLKPEEFTFRYQAVIEKSCICVGLGTSILLLNDLDTKVEGKGVSICPGPNLAYFSEILSLSQMVGHIYGEETHMQDLSRPNFLIKEIFLYLENLEKKIKETVLLNNQLATKVISEYISNLFDGFSYYEKVFLDYFNSSNDDKIKIQLVEAQNKLIDLENRFKLYCSGVLT